MTMSRCFDDGFIQESNLTLQELFYTRSHKMARELVRLGIDIHQRLKKTNESILFAHDRESREYRPWRAGSSPELFKTFIRL